MVEGTLERLAVEPAVPARYRLQVKTPAGRVESLDLNALLGSGLCIDFLGGIRCSHCGSGTGRSYGGGYCWGCFQRLARCDLCVVSPTRCHFGAGTCREPEWGASFCMQPHLVYLANSSGLKVGLTREGRQFVRWLDQGASQGLVVARAGSRERAGVLEAELARQVSDRTDWRALVTGDAPPLDLPRWRDTLERRLMDSSAPPDASSPLDGVEWLSEEPEQRLEFPVLAYPRRCVRLELGSEPGVAGRLVGIKGQYLLFEQGVFNVARHRAYQVRVSTFEASAGADPEPQMELFS